MCAFLEENTAEQSRCTTITHAFFLAAVCTIHKTIIIIKSSTCKILLFPYPRVITPIANWRCRQRPGRHPRSQVVSFPPQPRPRLAQALSFTDISRKTLFPSDLEEFLGTRNGREEEKKNTELLIPRPPPSHCGFLINGINVHRCWAMVQLLYTPLFGPLPLYTKSTIPKPFGILNTKADY